MRCQRADKVSVARVSSVSPVDGGTCCYGTSASLGEPYIINNFDEERFGQRCRCVPRRITLAVVAAIHSFTSVCR